MYECCHLYSPPPARVIIIQATDGAGIYATFGVSIATRCPSQDCASHNRRAAMTCLYCMIPGDVELLMLRGSSYSSLSTRTLLCSRLHPFGLYCQHRVGLLPVTDLKVRAEAQFARMSCRDHGQTCQICVTIDNPLSQTRGGSKHMVGLCFVEALLTYAMFAPRRLSEA
jgi:hypothetical protein